MSVSSWILQNWLIPVGARDRPRCQSCSWQLLLAPPNLPFACLPLTPASAAGTVGAGRARLALPAWGGYGCFGEAGGEAADGRTWEVLGLGPVCRGRT